MKKGTLFGLIFLGAFILHFFAPWWICALVAFAMAFWQASSAKQAFFVGGAAIGLLWFLVSMYWQLGSGGILSDKVATLFKMTTGGQLLGLVTLIAILVGGSAALTGYLVGQLFKK